MENVIKIIEAIGGQWPFLLVVFFITITITYRKKIEVFLSEGTRFSVKKGDIELQVQKEIKSLAHQATDSDPTNNDRRPEEVGSIDTLDVSEVDINREYFLAIHNRQFSKAKELLNEILKDEKDNDVKTRRKLSYFFLSHSRGDRSALKELEEFDKTIETSSPNKSHSLRYLARISKNLGDHKKAQTFLEEAQRVTNDQLEKAECISEISEIEYELENKEKSLSLLTESIEKLTEKRAKAKIYYSIALFYKKEKTGFFEALFYQKTFETDPNNVGYLFDAAYAYSQQENHFNDLSLIIYKKLANIDSQNSSGLNNLGVVYSNLKMPIKSTEFYKKAFDNQSTLAASNLANNLMYYGFSDEAEDYLKKALSMEKIDDNVYKSMADLKERIKKENDLEEKITIKAKKRLKFFSNYADQSISQLNFQIETDQEWKIDETKVEFVIEGQSLVVKWIANDSGKEHKISGKRFSNSFTLEYSRPEINPYSIREEKRYKTNEFSGFGYLINKKLLECLFMKEGELIEIKISSN